MHEEDQSELDHAAQMEEERRRIVQEEREGVQQTKPCVLCRRHLEPALDGWDTFQPYGGGEVQFIFGYGSRRFDLTAGVTVYRGIICDECAAKYTERMSAVS